MTALVTSRFATQETCDDVHDPQTLCPSVSSPARRPFGPSSGKRTASRSRLSFAWSLDNHFSPVISGVLPNSRLPSNHRPSIPHSFPSVPLTVINHVVRQSSKLVFLSLLVTLRE